MACYILLLKTIDVELPLPAHVPNLDTSWKEENCAVSKSLLGLECMQLNQQVFISLAMFSCRHTSSE